MRIIKLEDHPFSWSAILRITAALLLFYFIWKAAGVLVLILISIMLATALNPLIIKVNKYIPLHLASFLAVVLLLLPFIIVAVSLGPTAVNEFPHLLKRVNTLVNQSQFLPPTLRNIDFNQYAESGGRYILQSTGIITNIVSSTVIVFVLTFYLMVDSERLVRIFLSLFPRGKRTRIKHLFENLALINGQYIRGNLIISIICGIIIFIGLVFLGIPYAMPLALFTAIMDTLPLVGSSIGAIPAVIIAFSISPITGLLTVLLFVIYQQFEGAILSPAIYNKALKLSPSLGFMAVIIGSTLFGIVGAFLALPFTASLPAITEYLHNDTEENK